MCLFPCRLLRCRARWPVIRNSKTLSSRAKSWSNAVRFRRCSNGFGCFFDGGFRVWFVSQFFCVYILWWLWCVVILWEMHCAWRFLFAKSLSDASAYLRFNLGHYEVLVSQESRLLHRHVYIGADIAGIALLQMQDLKDRGDRDGAYVANSGLLGSMFLVFNIIFDSQPLHFFVIERSGFIPPCFRCWISCLMPRYSQCNHE